MADLARLETPRLLLDADRLERNAAMMRARAAQLGVTLRPHLKTPKSIDVARVAGGGAFLPGTVSTVNEAAYFARGGLKDLLFAQGFTLNKLPRILAIERETGARITLLTDDMGLLEALAAETARHGARVSLAIEIDSGEHRGGLRADNPLVVDLAKTAARAPSIDFRGVMTHAGHSYATNDLGEVRRIAGRERDAAVYAADAIRKAGVEVEIVSVGSSPTVLHAEHLNCVTEMRCGIYLFWDLSQYSRNVCRLDDIAMSVLTSVIGHNREQGYLLVDAGALAMSKDVGAHKYMPQAGFGLLCDAETNAPLGDLAIATVYQEHGVVPVRDAAWFDRLPVGAMARVLPNHACITAAAYPAYDVVRGARIIGHWPRTNGWD